MQQVLICAGIAMLVYTGSTAVYAAMFQEYKAAAFEDKKVIELYEGGMIGKLEIPRIDISVMVLHGLEESTLVAGAGHVPGTPLPGGDGNVVLAAHRDTYFRKLEGILPGDLIRTTTARGVYEYIVEWTEIVDPEDTRVMESRGYQELTLITCFPFYFVGSAPHRFIVHARPK